MQRNKKSFNGQKIFIGIDVHRRSWSVTTITESGSEHSHAQKPGAQELFDFLKKRYPHAEYHAVYEAGFTGMATYYALSDVGIKCIAIHPADVPTTQRDAVMKSDKVDSSKLARALRNGLLNGIYIRPKEFLDDRGIVRFRRMLIANLNAYKVRVKHLLHANGIELPQEFDRLKGSCWNGAFIKWLKEDVTLLSPTKETLGLILNQVERLRRDVLHVTRKIRELAATPKYEKSYNLLISIPGIGIVTAMTLLTELCEIKRFSGHRQFASYLGLIPTCHSSGERISNGPMTFRGNAHIKDMLIEAAWVAIRRDDSIGLAYTNLRRRMEPQKAIVRIAHKLSNIIFAVLKKEKGYAPQLDG